MGRTQRGSGLSVGELFNEAQRGTASAHFRYAKALCERVDDDVEAAFGQLVHVVKLFMSVPEKTVFQERILRFLGAFVARMESQEQLEFVEALVGQLTALSHAKDHTARWRACQLLQVVIGAMPPDAGLEDDVADELQSAMLERLEDTRPAVRMAAVRAMARLPNPGDDGTFGDCPVVHAMLELLATEKSKDVRKAIMASLPPAPITKQHFIERTRDEADEVRKVTYLSIAEKMALADLSKQEQALLIRRGLGDRVPVVADSAGRMLDTWLAGACGGDPLTLLRSIGVEQHDEECEMVVRRLITSGQLNAMQLCIAAEGESAGLRQDFGAEGSELLQPEAALLWRTICECLQSEATSKGLAAAAAAGAAADIDLAVASDRLEALEAALPPTVEEMTNIITKHAQAGPEHRFATGQLFLLAAQCMDFTDATARMAACKTLHTLLVDIPDSMLDEAGCKGKELLAAPWQSSSWRTALQLFMRKVHGSPTELADAMLTILGDLHTSVGLTTASDSTGVSEAAWLHMLGVAALMLEQLPSASAALAVAAPFSLQALLHELVQPGMQHTSAAVRREATRCLGLYCLMSDIPTALQSHVRVLREVLVGSEASSVKAMAAEVLGDLAAQRGIKELDRLIPPAITDASEATEAASNPLLDAELLRMPLLELLFTQLHGWLSHLDGSKLVRCSQGSTRATAAGAEVEVLGVAVVESVSRLLMCNRFWMQREQQVGYPLAIEGIELVKALVELLILNFDTRLEGTRVQQVLPVFLEAYPQQHDSHHQHLATALLPAARLAVVRDVESGKRITAASASSPKVMRYVASLLEAKVLQPDGQAVTVYHEELAHQLLEEVLKCAQLGAHKTYLATLCKLLVQLHINGANVEMVAKLRLFAEQAHYLLADKGMLKDIEALQARLLQMHDAPITPLTNEEKAILLDWVKRYEVDTLLEDYRLPFDEDSSVLPEAAPPTRRTAKTPAGKSRGRRKADTPSESSDDDEEEEEVDEGEEEKLRVAQHAKRAGAVRRGRQVVGDMEVTSSPALQPAQKVQRMRSTPFNKKSGKCELAAHSNLEQLTSSAAPAELSEEVQEQVAPAGQAAARKRSKAGGPKASLAAAAASHNSELLDEEERSDDDTSSPVPKPAQKVVRLRPTPFNKMSGITQGGHSSRLGAKGSKNAAANSDSSEEDDDPAPAARMTRGRNAVQHTIRQVVDDSSSEEDESEEDGPSLNENAGALGSKRVVQPANSDVSSLRRALSDNHI